MRTGKRISFMIAFILLFAVVMSACGSSPNTASMSYKANDEAIDTAGGYMDGEAGAVYEDGMYENAAADVDEATSKEKTAEDGGEEQTGVESAKSKDKLVYTCWITLQTLEFEKTEKAIKNAISKTGGIIENESVSDSDYTWYDETYKRTGTLNSTLTIRVPSAKYNEFLEMLEGTGGKITSKSQNVENITKRYNDQEIYIESLEKQEQRLMEMMEKAQSVEEMITVEGRLTEVQTNLNQAKSALASMDTDVKYSTVNLTLKEVVRYTDSPKTPVSFGERVIDAFKDSWDNFVDFVQGFIIAVIYMLPAIIFVALIVAIILIGRKSRLKKHPKEKRPKKEKKPNARAYDQRHMFSRKADGRGGIGTGAENQMPPQNHTDSPADASGRMSEQEAPAPDGSSDAKDNM